MSIRRGRPDKVSIVEVIEVVTATGNGGKEDPVRKLAQYWSLEGQLLAENDDIMAPFIPVEKEN